MFRAHYLTSTYLFHGVQPSPRVCECPLRASFHTSKSYLTHRNDPEVLDLQAQQRPRLVRGVRLFHAAQPSPGACERPLLVWFHTSKFYSTHPNGEDTDPQAQLRPRLVRGAGLRLQAQIFHLAKGKNRM